MKLNRLEAAGIISALMLVALAFIFAVTQQTVHAQSLAEEILCEIGNVGPAQFDTCQEDDGTDGDDGSDDPTPIDACDIYEHMGDLPPNCEEDEGEGEAGGDVCPDDEGVQTEGPCSSDDGANNEEDEGGSEDSDYVGSGSSGGSGGGSSGGGSGGGGSGGSGGGSGGGSVLGATTTNPLACEYMTGFVKEGAVNDFEQVARLQAFLKVFEGANVDINGAYDTASVAAVRAFQLKYSSDILAPWEIGNSTGYVYLTTRKKINEIYCARGMTFPLTVAEKQIIERTKAVAQGASDTHVHTEEPATEEPREEEGGTTSEVVDRPGNAVTNFFRRILDWFQ